MRTFDRGLGVGKLWEGPRDPSNILRNLYQPRNTY